MSARDELDELLATTELCATQARIADERAQTYARHYKVTAEEFRRLAARSRFPEIQSRLLRIAAASERLYNIAEGRAEMAASERDAPLRETPSSSGDTTRRTEDPISQARRHVAEAEARVERQEALIVRLSENINYFPLANQARGILTTLKHTLRLARDHLALELKKELS